MNANEARQLALSCESAAERLIIEQIHEKIKSAATTGLYYTHFNSIPSNVRDYFEDLGFQVTFTGNDTCYQISWH